jgi:hypothetical protein
MTERTVRNDPANWGIGKFLSGLKSRFQRVGLFDLPSVLLRNRAGLEADAVVSGFQG